LPGAALAETSELRLHVFPLTYSERSLLNLVHSISRRGSAQVFKDLMGIEGVDVG
jgi:hypothetical protein